MGLAGGLATNGGIFPSVGELPASVVNVTSPATNQGVLWNGSAWVAAGTQTPLDNSVKPATTAYADAAVAVETSRATTAEGLAVLKANNLSDVTAASARTNLGLGTAATQASTAFDAAGLSAAETTRATTAEALKAPIASPTFTGTTTAPEFTASGLTGATAASRYVGATASGAPVSGTFAIGDFTVDQVGTVWVCTVAGSPGTWVSATSNELQYAERTSDLTNLGPAVADITGLSITFTPPTAQVRLLVDIPLITKNTSAGWILGYITDNSNNAVGRKATTVGTIGGFGGMSIHKKIVGLTPGVSVTYKARIQCQADTVTISGSSLDVRSFIQAFAA